MNNLNYQNLQRLRQNGEKLMESVYQQAYVDFGDSKVPNNINKDKIISTSIKLGQTAQKNDFKSNYALNFKNQQNQSNTLSQSVTMSPSVLQNKSNINLGNYQADKIYQSEQHDQYKPSINNNQFQQKINLNQRYKDTQLFSSDNQMNYESTSQHDYQVPVKQQQNSNQYDIKLRYQPNKYMMQQPSYNNGIQNEMVSQMHEEFNQKNIGQSVVSLSFDLKQSYLSLGTQKNDYQTTTKQDYKPELSELPEMIDQQSRKNKSDEIKHHFDLGTDTIEYESTNQNKYQSYDLYKIDQVSPIKRPNQVQFGDSQSPFEKQTTYNSLKSPYNNINPNKRYAGKQSPKSITCKEILDQFVDSNFVTESQSKLKKPENLIQNSLTTSRIQELKGVNSNIIANNDETGYVDNNKMRMYYNQGEQEAEKQRIKNEAQNITKKMQSTHIGSTFLDHQKNNYRQISPDQQDWINLNKFKNNMQIRQEIQLNQQKHKSSSVFLRNEPHFNNNNNNLLFTKKNSQI